MNIPEDEAGFDKPLLPGDNIVRELRRKHAVPEDASLAVIEPVATALLGSPLTAMDGAQLVLNRCVDAKEKMIGELLFVPGFTPQQRFGLLLMELTTESEMKKQGKTDFGTKVSIRDQNLD